MRRAVKNAMFLAVAGTLATIYVGAALALVF